MDRIAELLEEWDVEHFLVHGGLSSVTTRGRMPGNIGWPVSVTNPYSDKVLGKFELYDRAMCGSGLQKGHHIIDPRNGQPLQRKRAAWAFTPDATTGDGLSTAFMVMDIEEIEEYCRERPEISALIVDHENGTLREWRFGEMEE